MLLCGSLRSGPTDTADLHTLHLLEHRFFLFHSLLFDPLLLGQCGQPLHFLFPVVLLEDDLVLLFLVEDALCLRCVLYRIHRLFVATRQLRDASDHDRLRAAP